VWVCECVGGEGGGPGGEGGEWTSEGVAGGQAGIHSTQHDAHSLLTHLLTRYSLTHSLTHSLTQSLDAFSQCNYSLVTHSLAYGACVCALQSAVVESIQSTEEVAIINQEE
jgi:hypothetical protein